MDESFRVLDGLMFSFDGLMLGCTIGSATGTRHEVLVEVLGILAALDCPSPEVGLRLC